jgi:hypothetical protein
MASKLLLNFQSFHKLNFLKIKAKPLIISLLKKKLEENDKNKNIKDLLSKIIKMNKIIILEKVEGVLF